MKFIVEKSLIRALMYAYIFVINMYASPGILDLT